MEFAYLAAGFGAGLTVIGGAFGIFVTAFYVSAKHSPIQKNVPSPYCSTRPTVKENSAQTLPFA